MNRDIINQDKCVVFWLMVMDKLYDIQPEDLKQGGEKKPSDNYLLLSSKSPLVEINSGQL